MRSCVLVVAAARTSRIGCVSACMIAACRSQSHACVCVCAVAVVASVHAAISGDLITNLPGYSGNTPSPQYSGMMSVNQNNGRSLHYWFVTSENSPSTDPLVVWFNGGPGCSSLDGFFYEHGPLHFANDTVNSDGVPQLVDNPFRWNLFANVLFVEAPAGVGFSYSQNINDYNTNDNITADDNYRFILNFLQAYPEYQNNTLYISGESYAGIYVPMLAERVMLGNTNLPPNQRINFGGIMVGNGCTGNSVGSCSPQGTRILVEFLYGHGLFSMDLMSQIKANCPDLSNPNTVCSALLSQMSDQVSDVNIYDIYGPCINGGFSEERRNLLSKLKAHRRRTPGNALTKSVGGPDECIDGIMAGVYLNIPAVRQALHVPDQSVIPQWTICTNQVCSPCLCVSVCEHACLCLADAPALADATAHLLISTFIPLSSPGLCFCRCLAYIVSATLRSSTTRPTL
jgi:serine carboxypeptidase-like clade I